VQPAHKRPDRPELGEEPRAGTRPEGMVYNPHTYLDLARAREQDLLRAARRQTVHPSSRNERPGALARIAALLRRRPARPAAPAPV